jgi:hypothetical protein
VRCEVSRVTNNAILSLRHLPANASLPYENPFAIRNERQNYVGSENAVRYASCNVAAPL